MTIYRALTTRQDKAESLGVLMERAWCGLVLYGGDRFYDREAAKANETAFIGCRYGYGGTDEFGDGDLLAEDSVENTWATETAGFLHTLAETMAETMAEAMGGHGAGITGDCVRIPGFHNLLKRRGHRL